MLFFQKRFLDGLVSGAVTVTFRRWTTAKVRAGGRYRAHPIGVMVVDAIERVPFSAVTPAEARMAGFRSLRELREYLLQGSDEPLKPASLLFKVTMHHGGDGDFVPGALDASLDADEAHEIEATLALLDEKATERWTADTLKLIELHPRVAASRLAKEAGRPTPEFKADVVKLKKLGLTQSFEVGYQISPKGETFLRSRRKRRPRSSV